MKSVTAEEVTTVEEQREDEVVAEVVKAKVEGGGEEKLQKLSFLLHLLSVSKM